MDYMFLTSYGWTATIEEAEELVAKASNPCRTISTILVLKDYVFGSVWAYPVAGQGFAAAPNVIDHVLGDLAACGLDKARLISKNDQEVAIRELQDELSRRRREVDGPGTAEENSRVGDSCLNGRIERCIQELGKSGR